jgi:hypothetical protein
MDALTLASMKAAASCETRYELQILLNVRLPNALGADVTVVQVRRSLFFTTLPFGHWF